MLPLIGAVLGIVAAVLGVLSFIFSLSDVGKAVMALSISIAVTDVVLAVSLFVLWRAFFAARR
jgi:flagellar motor component MotA